MINKNEKRIQIMRQALLDIGCMDTGHKCACQCANHAIEHANTALKEEEKLRWYEVKTDRCFSFHLPDMDRLFGKVDRWNWRAKNHLTREWKELAESIRLSMNYSPAYNTGDILHRWFGKWRKYRNHLPIPKLHEQSVKDKAP